MSALAITLWCAVGLGLVVWWLTRPAERWVRPWKPCRNCKRVWREDEWGSLEFMTPLSWYHFKDAVDLCPRCQEALEAIAEIEQRTVVYK